jgi:hypothetical protein
VWDKVFRDLVADRRNLYLMIDSTIVRAHQQAATGRKKGVRTRLWGVPKQAKNKAVVAVARKLGDGKLPSPTRGFVSRRTL